MSLKAKIEAVLFLTSKPIKAQAIARIVNADVQAVRQSLLELVHDYEAREGGLEIADDDGYTFQVKDQYSSLMDEFMPIEMSAALIRTLSAIAIKQPICQSEIIRVRGAGAYDHIRELVGKDLVVKKEEQGERSPMLSTTKKFQEYFKLTKDGKDLRNFLKKQVRKAEVAAAAAGERQLSIASVVSPEADEHLNQRIFLETADHGSDSESIDHPIDGTLEEVVFKEDMLSPEGVPEIQAVQVEAEPVIEEPLEMPAQVVTPATTLSKLAEAAEAKEPTPPVADPPTSTSSVQASTAKRKEPKTGKLPEPDPKEAKQGPSGLAELLQKQKLLQRDFKQGFLDDGHDVVPIVSDPTHAKE